MSASALKTYGQDAVALAAGTIHLDPVPAEFLYLLDSNVRPGQIRQHGGQGEDELGGVCRVATVSSKASRERPVQASAPQIQPLSRY
jgi:hypothetical protein